MSVRIRTAALLSVVLVAPVSCAGLGGDRSGTLPFKVAIIPFEPTVVPGDAAATTDDASFEASFDPSMVEESIRAALATRFTEAVVLQPPAGATLAEFLRRPRSEQDSHWIRACAGANVDLVLECDVKLPDRARCSHNEAFWLNLPIFFIGGPICWFVDDTDYDADARLVASLHQVIPIAEGRATLSNGRAEVARFDARFDGVRLDFIDRAETWSYPASIVVPPGLLANDNTRVRRRFALAVGDGLASNLARQVAETSDSIRGIL